jgi:hypothetical protein
MNNMSAMTAPANPLPRPRQTGRARLLSRLLWILAISLPAALVVGVAAGMGNLLALALGGAALLVWSLVDVRVTFLTAVLAASFVDYSGGRLTLELGIVCAWLAWTGMILFWRHAWVGWKRPPAGVLLPLAVWGGACALGLILGFLNGNSTKFLGLEILAAGWPFLALGVMQVYRQRDLGFVLKWMFAIGLGHTVYGMVMLRIIGHRIGNVYFTTIPAIIAVGFWIGALFSPRPALRFLFLLGMVPLLTHLFFSFTRGYWLGFIVAIVVSTILTWRALNRSGTRAMPRIAGASAGMTLALLLMGSVAVLYVGGGDVFESAGRRFGSSFSSDASGETASNIFRLVEYAEALQAIFESPVVGHGFGHTIEFRDPFLGDRSNPWFIHNYYLYAAVKMGVLGLLAFGFLIWRLLRNAQRLMARDIPWQTRAWAIGCIAVTLQVLAILLTNFNMAEVNTAFLVAFAWGVLWSFDRSAGETPAPEA